MTNGTEAPDTSPPLKDRATELYLSVGGVTDNLTEAQREFIEQHLTRDERLSLGDRMRRAGQERLNEKLLDEFAKKFTDNVFKTELVLNALEERDKEKAAFERRQHMATLECRTYKRTDLGNSKRLSLRYGKEIRFCFPTDTWYRWNGRKWDGDDIGGIYELGKETTIRIGDEAGLTDGEQERAAHYKWAASSQGRTAISNMIFLSRSTVPILTTELDAKKNLLNCPNCTLDLVTLKRKDHDREDFCTKETGVEFDPAALCPLWEKHLNTIFAKNQDRIRDFQRMAGYSLLADNPEQLFFIAHGGGCNGKGVTMSTIAYVMGDYCVSVSPDTLIANKNAPRGGEARADLIPLIGARLILSSENERGGVLAEGLIKMMTGDDTLSFRGCYEKKQRNELLTGKLWLSTNHMPRITGTDFAIWRRVCRVPFEVTIPETERNIRIKEMLREEGPGILNWMLKGLQMIYQEKDRRLKIPDWVRLATEEYKKESDVFGQFVSDKLLPGGEISRAALAGLYQAWCNENSIDPQSNRSITGTMRERGCEEKVLHGKRYWVGFHDKEVSML